MVQNLLIFIIILFILYKIAKAFSLFGLGIAKTKEDLSPYLQFTIKQIGDGLSEVIGMNQLMGVLYNPKTKFVKVELIYKVSYEEADKYMKDYKDSGKYPHIYLERYDRFD